MRAGTRLGPTGAMLVLVAGCAGIATVPEQQRSPHFEAVAAKLDIGGTVFMYADMEGDFQRVAKLLDQVARTLAEQTGEEMLARIDVPRMVERLGLDGIAATGLSSYREGDTFCNKSFSRLLGPRRGVLRVVGGAPHEMELPRLAPRDVDLAFETDLNLKAIYEATATVMQDIMGEKADMVLARLEQRLPGMPISPMQIIDELDTRLVFVLRIDVKRPVQLPFVQFPVPRIDLLLAADNLALLYDVVRDQTRSIPALQQDAEGELELIEAIQPLPGGLQPVLAKDPASKRLFFATSRSFLTEYLDPAGALGASPAFARATRGFPVQANAISYLGPDLVGKVIGFAERASEAYPEVRPYVGLLSGLLPEPGIPMAAVQANLPGGIYSVSRSTMSHKGTLAAVLYANPVVAAFFLAGMMGGL